MHAHKGLHQIEMLSGEAYSEVLRLTKAAIDEQREIATSRFLLTRSIMQPLMRERLEYDIAARFGRACGYIYRAHQIVTGD